jgi:hypothetical protein
MDRREFLKLGGAVTTAAFLHNIPKTAFASKPAEAFVNGNMYRGTADGKILLSEDGGITWRTHTNFGNDLEILEILANPRGQVFARLGFQGHSFALVLDQNGKSWKSMPRLRTA